MTAARSPRGTASRNERGSAADRRRRKEWLVETFRADMDYAPLRLGDSIRVGVPVGMGYPACRCFRCGRLLTVETVTPDRIIPGCKGGTYRRNNIRPACLDCNRELGQPHALAARRKDHNGPQG